MKVHEIRTLLAFVKLLPDEALEMIADAAWMTAPRDNLDRAIFIFATGEREWRAL